RDARGVDVGVALELAREMALVVARAQQEPPARVDELAGGLGERPDARVERDQLLAQRAHALPELVLGRVAADAVAALEPLQREADAREAMLELLFLRHQRRDLGLLLLERLERLELVLE